MSIKRQLIWSFLANLAPKVLSPVVFIVLARLLTPKDFGLLTMAMVIVSFMQIFRDAGLGQAIIQSEKKNTADFIFTVQLLMGILLFVLLFVASPLISHYFRSPEVKPVVRILALLFIISPFIDVPLHLEMREIEFKTVFLRNSLAPVLSGIVSVALAYMDFRYWALVWGQLLGQAMTALFFLVYVGWKPRLSFRWAENKQSLRFGSHILFQGVFTWLIRSADRFLIGRYQSAMDVGYYEIGSRASKMLHDSLAQPVNRLVYPVMAREVREQRRIGDLYLKVIGRIALISLPVGAYLICMSEFLFSLFLGGKWQNSIILFELLLVGKIVASLGTLNTQVYKASNRPDIASKFLGVRGFISLPVYYFSLKHGLVALAASRAILAIIFGPLNAYVATRVLGISFRDFIKALRYSGTVTAVYVFLYAIIGFLRLPATGELVVNTVGVAALILAFVCKAEPELVHSVERKWAERGMRR